MHSIKSLGLIVFTAALISACSSNPQRDILTEQEYYREAREAIEDNNMLVAEDRLNRLESQYPFGKYAEQAQRQWEASEARDLDNIEEGVERLGDLVASGWFERNAKDGALSELMESREEKGSQ